MTDKRLAVLDANLVVYLLTDPPTSGAARLWEMLSHEHQVVMPDLARWEMVNAFYRIGSLGQMSVDMVESAIVAMVQLGLIFDAGTRDHVRATRIASQCGFRQAYDAHYLALAERLGCPFWTADKELHRQSTPFFDFVYLVERSLSQEPSKGNG